MPHISNINPMMIILISTTSLLLMTTIIWSNTYTNKNIIMGTKNNISPKWFW